MGKKRVIADMDACQGYGNCVVAAPDVFSLGLEGKVGVQMSEIDETRTAEVQRAIDGCPMEALSWAAD